VARAGRATIHRAPSVPSPSWSCSPSILPLTTRSYTLHLSSRGLTVLLVHSAFCVANLSLFYLPISLSFSPSISIATFPFPFPQTLSFLSLVYRRP
jgi:hypothetical protein